jgi:hypothetical protein
MIAGWKRLCSEERRGAPTRVASRLRILRDSTKNSNAILT